MHTAPLPQDERHQDLLDNCMRDWQAAAWRVLHRLTVCPDLWIASRMNPAIIMDLTPHHFPPGDYAIIAQAIEDTLRDDAAATFETIGKAALEAGADLEVLLALLSPPEAHELEHLTPEAYVQDANGLWDAATRHGLAWLFIGAAREKAMKGHRDA